MKYNILLLKETKANEQRVALIPSDISILTQSGHHVFVEHGAGDAAGFSDQKYMKAGALIRHNENANINSYKSLFHGIDIVVRAKRPSRDREILENKALQSAMVMVGALDPFEFTSPHIQEYADAGITVHSIDQLDLRPDDPMNVLSAMSDIAGKLAFIDAMDKSTSDVKRVTLVGYGRVNKSAFKEAFRRGLEVTVMLRNKNEAQEILNSGAKTVLIDKHADLKETQQLIEDNILNADIVITSARSANRPAPLLLPKSTLNKLNQGTVVVDMALSEGGNVEGSAHDTTLTLGNGVIVTNVSGYPKALPHESSKLWSRATLLFLKALLGIS